MDLATVYISRTNHCSRGQNAIQLYKGADSSEKQEERILLIQYLKESKQQPKTIECIYYLYVSVTWWQ